MSNNAPIKSERLKAMVAQIEGALDAVFGKDEVAVDIKYQDGDRYQDPEIRIGDYGLFIADDFVDNQIIIGIEHIIPGVHYCADGSGEPDCIDPETIGVFDPAAVMKIAEAAVAQIAKIRFANHLEGLQLQEMDKLYDEMETKDE